MLRRKCLHARSVCPSMFSSITQDLVYQEKALKLIPQKLAQCSIVTYSPPEGRGLLVSTTERSISTSVDLDVPQPISLIMCNPSYIFCPHVWQLTKVCSYNPS